jgi:hypothetical protein
MLFADQTGSQSMAHTFDIRFARSAGLVGWLEAPGNRFRWKGDGRLSIDAQGISIAVRRGLLTLFSPQSRRIAADQLTEVYREGDALRLEFTAPGAPRTVVPFWARDLDAAAEIVRLLPTRKTVELEHPPPGAQQRFRPDWRVIVTFLVVAAAALYGAWLMRAWALHDEPTAVVTSTQLAQSGPEPMTESSAPATNSAGSTHAEETSPVPGQVSVPAPNYLDASETDEAAVEDTITAIEPATSSMEIPPGTAETPAPAWRGRRPVREGITAIVPGDAIYEIARRQLEIFETESNDRTTNWWSVTVRIHNTEEFQHPDLVGMRETMLAVSRAWRAGDADFALMLTARVRLYVY